MKTKYPGISKTPDGRFKVRVVIIDPRTGKRMNVRKIMSHGANLEEALTEQLRIKQEIRVGHPNNAPNKQRSVTDYAVRWLEVKARRVRKGVAERYEQVLSTHILPRLGDIYLESITREDVEDWVTWVESIRMNDGRPYARDTIMGFWSILRRFLKDAAASAGIPDPTYRVDPPNPEAIQRRELRTLSAAQLVELLDNVKQFAPNRYAEAYLLAYTGMRPGELFALLWENIREADKRIDVLWSVRRGVVNATKTGVGRQVAYLDTMTPILRAHRKRLVAMQHIGLKTGLVFPADTGVYRLSQSLHKPLALAAEAAGIDVRVTPQVLRRTFNTLMLELKVDRIVLRSQMGHSSEEMTERYAGVAIEAKRRAVSQLLAMTKEAA